MSFTFEVILLPILEKYMSMEYHLLPNVLGYEIKQDVGRIRNMRLKIYTNDHNPPHFHVVSLDGSVDAKFTIENCTLLSGQISQQDIKRVEAFYNAAQARFKSVWNKRDASN